MKPNQGLAATLGVYSWGMWTLFVAGGIQLPDLGLLHWENSRYTGPPGKSQNVSGFED